MSENLLRRLERVQDYFVREGLGFDDYCMCIEEAIKVLTEQASRLQEVTKAAELISAADSELRRKLADASSRLGEIVKWYEDGFIVNEGREDLNRLYDLARGVERGSTVETCPLIGGHDWVIQNRQSLDGKIIREEWKCECGAVRVLPE